MLSLHSLKGAMSEWLGTGLQNRLQQFESAWHLKNKRVALRLVFIFEVP